MNARRESLMFGLTAASAAALLVSIAAGETLLFLAVVLWLIWRPRQLEVPVYFFPLIAFTITTAISLSASPQPSVGWGPVFKVILLPMGVLAATFVNTPWRARTSIAIFAGVSALTSSVALIQFGRAYARFLTTHQVADDPTISARITGFMGHWMTFSGEQLLIWCAAVPALIVLGRRWTIPVAAVGGSLILTFTRSAWLGAIAGITSVALLLPRRLFLPVLLPLAIVAAISSGLIYHRIALSFESASQGGVDNGAGEGVAARIKLWKAGVQMIHDHPLFGVGPQRIVFEFPKYYRGTDVKWSGHLENNFIQIAAERGLLCFATFLWFLIELYTELIRMLKSADAGIRWIVLSALSALTGFVVSGFFEFNFGNSQVFLLLLFIVSLPYGVIHERVRTE